jgi:hypothetical protein
MNPHPAERPSSILDSPIHQAAYSTRNGEWEDYRPRVNEFAPTFRGRLLTHETALDPGKLTSTGFVILDKQAAPFKLEVARVKTSVESGR